MELLLLLQLLFDELSEHVDGYIIVAALRDDDVGVAFAGLNELLMHGLEHSLIALNDSLCGPAAFNDVAFDDADETIVGIGINEDLHIHLRAELLVA